MEYEKILKKECTLHNFKLMLKITLDRGDSIDNDSIITKDKYIFLYNYPNIIKVYDCIKFKRIALLKLPITPVKYKIIDFNYILIYSRNKLFFYSINLLESKLIFKFIIPDIFLFTYLNEKNEILIITQKDSDFVRVNLEGEIKFKQKNEIKINFDEKEVEKNMKINSDDDDFIEDAYIPSGYYNFLYGFNSDKYIFKYFGYYLSSGDPYDNYSDEYYDIRIFNIENMKEIISDENSIYCRCKKLTDTLFIDEDGNEPIIYYDEKDNKIKYLDNIFQEGKYFSLDNKSKIEIFIQPDIIYLIDFTKETKKSIKLNQSYEISNILNIGYYCEKGNEYLFLLIRNKNFICDIIKGKII